MTAFHRVLDQHLPWLNTVTVLGDHADELHVVLDDDQRHGRG